MADASLCAASTVAGCLVAPVNRLCGYVISYDSHVCKLEDRVAELGQASDRVQDSIREARDNMKPIKHYVNQWVKDVEKHAEEACRVLDDKAKITCFCGWLPNPKVRYRLGREARRKAERIQGLINQTPSGKVYDDPPPGLVDGASDVISSADDRGDIIFDSRASILEEIMNALDDEKHKVIGIYGEGGVGKTKLLEQVEKKLRNEKRLFDMIVKANVSQNPDLKKIQDDIAYALGLENLKNETSEEGRRDLLFKRLQNDPSEKVLIILDDLWKDLDLRKVGIPSRDESKGCKLLLTSRSKIVLEQTECHDSIFRLERLKDDEAFGLFEKTVGDRLKDNEELKTIADQLVKKLAGLPLLINSVAKSLKNRHVAAWSSALKTIDPSHTETIVKWSYDHLKSEDTKTLFLLCGLIGGTIRVEILLGLGMGLGLFEESRLTMQESRDRLYTMLDDLRFACLLLDGGDDKDNVTIHDLYSEAVVSTPFRGQNSLMMNSNYGSMRKEKLEKCWAICLTDVDRVRLAELMKYQFPDLKILMLSQLGIRNLVLERQYDTADCSILPDFTSTKELQVLYVRSIRIANLPSSIGILGNLHSLYLDHCNVEDVAILGKLKALQILSLAWSAISRLPKEMGDLTNLRSLNLSNCHRLRTIEPGVLKCLINLEELYLRGSFNQWMGKDGISSESCNAGLAELKSLTKIASLEISIADSSVLLEDDDFPFGNLIKFWINIGNADRRTNRGLRTMELKLEEWDIFLSKEWVQKILQKTQYLYLDGLKKFKKNTFELCTEGFRELKCLEINNSPSIEYLANSSNGLPLTAFTILESLFLRNLINLEKICNSLVAPKCFSILKAVTIGQCHRLKNLWFLSEMQRLVHLEVLRVFQCDSMRAIITDGAGEIEVLVDDTVELPNLRHLNLHALPKMTSFCTGAEGAPIQVSLPSLDTSYLSDVLEMGGSFKRIWHSELPRSSFCELATLTIKFCKGLLNVFPSTIIGRLQNLKEIFILYCNSLESLFDCGSLDANIELTTVSLPKLERVEITRASKLRCIVKADSQMILGFPSLKEVDVLDCRELRYLFPNFTATTLEKLESIKISLCHQMKEVVLEKGGGQSKADVMSFPSLRDLSIWHCCNLGVFIRSPTSAKRQLGETAEENNEWPQPFFNEMVTFPNIRSLLIGGLQCTELWDNQIPANSFSILKSLGLKACNNLQRVAPSHMWKRLQRCLEDLKVVSCCSIEIVYEGDRMDIEGGKLRWLYLRDLKNLRRIWQSDGLPNIPFPNLREVEVVECSRLEMLFTTFTAKFLGQIEELVVESCENIELIAGHEIWEEATSTTITFSELTTLRLFKLPKFRSFLPEKYSLKFPCPEDLEHFPSLQVWSIESCGEEPNQVNVDWEKHYIERLRRRSPRDKNLWEKWWLHGSSFLRHSPCPLPSIH